jgi:sugar phosphate isomerase/epimerase
MVEANFLEGKRMAFCLGSRLVSNLPLTDYLREAVQHFTVIELQADPKYFSSNFAFTANERKVLRIYQDRFQFRLTMHAPFVNIHLGALNLEERQLSISIFLNTMRISGELGVQLITFHPSPILPELTEQQYQDVCLFEEGSISILLKEAKKLGVTLLIENMPNTPKYHPSTRDGSRFQELLWLFPEPEFGLTVDVGHALQAGVAVEAFLKMERVRHFHFHENDRVSDLHQPIQNNVEWWGKLVKGLVKKFPETIGILELTSLKDQIESLNNLHKSLPKQSNAGQRRELMIPPIVT